MAISDQSPPSSDKYAIDKVYTGPLGNPGNLPPSLSGFLGAAGIAGLCEAQMKSSQYALLPYRFDSLNFRWTLTVAGTVVTAALASGSSGDFFTKNVGETKGSVGSAGALLTLTHSTASTEKEGALIPVGMVYIITGIEGTMLAPSFASSATAVTPGGVTTEAANALFTQNLGVSAAADLSINNPDKLDSAFRQGPMRLASLKVTFQDTDCAYELGPMLHWNGALGVQGGSSNSTNQVPNGAFLPIFRTLVATSRNSTNQLAIHATMDDASGIVFANSTAAAFVAVTAHFVDCLMQLRLFGFPLCVSDVVSANMAQSPAVQALIQQQVAAAIAQMNR